MTNSYTHRFKVNASLSSVAAFHQDPASMGAITPPPIRVELHRAPTPLSSGSNMDFTLWFGPFPIHWSARIEEVSEAGFTDRQLGGPFAAWVHRHSFERIDDTTTEVIDQITLQVKPHLLWGAIGLGFKLGLPVLFAYRGWKTRRRLEKGAG
jgi:ligand-binding SRPBCC domain-containing protein